MVRLFRVVILVLAAVVAWLASPGAVEAGPPPFACPETPFPGCRHGAAGRSTIFLRDVAANPAKDQLVWRWNKGTVTDVGDYANPVSGSADYRVCLYDSSINPQPLRDLTLVPGGACGTEPCWKTVGVSTPRGYKLRNALGTPDGVTDVKLLAGTIGKARILVKGKGANLQMPPLGLTPPVTIQLLIDDGVTTECWETAFSNSELNTPEVFKARGP